MLDRFVVLETDLSKKIESEKSEYNDPYCKVYLSVEDAPVVCLVCNAEELQSESYLYKTENNLD